jgi:hypothetical protein
VYSISGSKFSTHSPSRQYWKTSRPSVVATKYVSVPRDSSASVSSQQPMPPYSSTQKAGIPYRVRTGMYRRDHRQQCHADT